MSAGRQATSKKKDWNTPPKYSKLITDFFGTIDLDPCSNEHSLIPATTQFILPTDGLQESWIGYQNIFINPPYGRDPERKTRIYDWIAKGVEAYKKGSEVIFLIPVATNTSHFKDLIFTYGKGICFLEDTRLKFWSQGSEDKKGAPMACCLVYFGEHYSRFKNIFQYNGQCFKII